VVINPQIVSPAAIKKAQILLEGVVEEGTGASIKSPFYKIAGKTGTAQIAAGNKGYRQGTKQVQYKGSFIGYFPADDPKYSCIVVIVNPKKGKYYGGAVAAPVFRELSDKLFAIRPDILIPLPFDSTLSLVPVAQKGQKMDLSDAYKAMGFNIVQSGGTSVWAQPGLSNEKVILTAEPVARGVMPDVKGMGLKDAIYMLEGMGMNVLVKGKGTVVRQTVQPGSLIHKGMPVVIELELKNFKSKTAA